ncbi:hypothetical protein AB1J28_20250 [Lysinibacillus irui]|uniref:hypothetical protein n=1 Tax=Lysinibacillus TaxID=400634 RepID=UPI0028A1B468|nr:hypothetical protein [Lysinibacillus boronitolerans]
MKRRSVAIKPFERQLHVLEREFKKLSYGSPFYEAKLYEIQDLAAFINRIKKRNYVEY